MLRIITGTIVIAALAMNLTRAFQIQKWVMTLYLLVLAICLYFLNVALIRYFIKKRAPEFANDQMWEATAGTGIVPKWVSSIGLFSISALIAAVVPWLIALFKLMAT